ncbi:glutathione S-transferase family protein [Acuticoccus mangrovi]|uniref:Glutathione S-transferase family protein n=1 Tax=Acuticoccus mangrovi TaxID=2796142 RepID=A0A934MNW8_9HYPH|nr:glutathione S-transferase family protein [Acuticoccus mangrovi]MBJ3778574.1 glutathione S-transferase family protein [Acuticoccus mangrovi]
MLTIWGRATSVNVQKVMWVVGELGLPHTRINAGGPFGGLDTPEFLAMNPHGLVPVIKTDDGLVMWESNAIVRHLAMADPGRHLWPAASPAGPTADMWAEWAQTVVQRTLLGVFVNIVRVPPSKQQPAVIEGHRRELVAALQTAEAQLADRSFLAGESLTIADIVFGSALYRYHELDIARPALPALSAYYGKLCSRPAYAEHVMVDISGMYVKD